MNKDLALQKSWFVTTAAILGIVTSYPTFAADGGLVTGRILNANVDSGASPAILFGAANGLSSASASESPLQMETPNVKMSFSAFSATLTVPPCHDALSNGDCGVPGGGIDVTLRVDNADTPLTCHIDFPDTSCHSTKKAQAVVAAGSKLAIEVSGELLGTNQAAFANREVLFGLKGAMLQ